MAFLEEVLDGVSALQEIIHFRSADDVKLIILVFLLVFGFPLFLILKGWAREIFVGIILGILFGVLVSNFFLMVGFIGGMLLPLEVLLVLYLALCLVVVGVIARITYKNYRTFALVFSSVSLLLTVYGVLKNFFSLISN